MLLWGEGNIYVPFEMRNNSPWVSQWAGFKQFLHVRYEIPKIKSELMDHRVSQI
jgi:hypothetical protein